MTLTSNFSFLALWTFNSESKRRIYIRFRVGGEGVWFFLNFPSRNAISEDVRTRLFLYLALMASFWHTLTLRSCLNQLMTLSTDNSIWVASFSYSGVERYGFWKNDSLVREYLNMVWGWIRAKINYNFKGIVKGGLAYVANAWECIEKSFSFRFVKKIKKFTKQRWFLFIFLKSQIKIVK